MVMLYGSAFNYATEWFYRKLCKSLFWTHFALLNFEMSSCIPHTLRVFKMKKNKIASKITMLRPFAEVPIGASAKGVNFPKTPP